MILTAIFVTAESCDTEGVHGCSTNAGSFRSSLWPPRRVGLIREGRRTTSQWRFIHSCEWFFRSNLVYVCQKSLSLLMCLWRGAGLCRVQWVFQLSVWVIMLWAFLNPLSWPVKSVTDRLNRRKSECESNMEFNYFKAPFNTIVTTCLFLCYICAHIIYPLSNSPPTSLSWCPCAFGLQIDFILHINPTSSTTSSVVQRVQASL